MSWQAMVDQNLVGTGQVQKAGIFGIDGNPWAVSSGFVVPESKTIAGSFANDKAHLFNGIFINKEKYTFLQQDDEVLLGRKGADGGCVIVKTKQTVVIAVFAGVQPGACRSVVEKLTDYLKSTGY